MGFWGVDFLRGSKVRNHYAEIKYIMENQVSPDVTIMQERYLNDILKYATENVEFYKKFKDYDSLKSFPVINKNIIRNNFETFQAPEFLNAAVVTMHTSGSTGMPFIARQDKNKRNRVYAEMIYFWGKAGYQIGMKYIMFRTWTSLTRKNWLTAWARNILMIDVRSHDEKNLKNIRNILKSEKKIKTFIGYTSFLENLANYLLASGDTSEMYRNIHTIITNAEALPETTRRKLKGVFNCIIVSLYSNEENGILAQECVENKEFHMNSASYHIELLKIDSDNPAGVGEPGRIVVTDLFNHAMPLIRYDTGDTGTWRQEAECGWQSQVFSTVQGRLIDAIFNTKGENINSQSVDTLMYPFDNLLQFQFVQEGTKQFTLRLNGAEGHYEDATFVELFKGFLGQDAEIVIEHVHEIPVMESGKRKFVVNNMPKEKHELIG